MNPKISVIIPTYNRAHFIGDAIRSAEEQIFPPYEIIVVDDGSTDSTRAVIDSILAKRTIEDIPVVRVWQGNNGVASARNTGANYAKGDYIVFLDSDDVMNPNALQFLSRYHEFDVVFGRAVNVNMDDGSKTEYIHEKTVACELRSTVSGPFRQAHKRLKDCNCIAIGAVMIKASIFRGEGGFDTMFKTSEDYELWLRMSSHGHSFGYVNFTMLERRLHSGNAVNSKPEMAAGTAKALLKYAPDHSRLDALHYDAGSAYFWRRDWGNAAYHLACVKHVASLAYLTKLTISACMLPLTRLKRSKKTA